MLTFSLCISFKTIHLQPLGDDGGCDELVGGDLLVQLVVGALVTPHQVVQLVPGLSLGPFLLLGPLMATMVTSVSGWWVQTLLSISLVLNSM